MKTISSADEAFAREPLDPSKYPAFEGQWIRIGPIERFDPTKQPARGQQAPLTAEYNAIFEANLADVAKGGFGDDPVYSCIPEGMPRAMNLVLPMEIVAPVALFKCQSIGRYYDISFFGQLRGVPNLIDELLCAIHPGEKSHE